MHTKLSPRSSSLLAFGPVLFALGALFAASPAQAGFQWVAPNASAPTAPEAAAPVSVDPQTLPPIPTLNAPVPAKPPVAQPPAAPEKPVDQGAPVRGFANKVPLSVALRQVLPAEVGYSLAQDVSLGTVVSWKGGSPWRQVMKDMLAPAGLSFKEQGGIVSIARGEGLSAPQPNTFPNVPASVAPSPALKPVSAPPATAPAAALSPKPVAPTPMAEPGKPTLLAPQTLAPAPTSFGAPSPVVSEPTSAERRDVTVDAWVANKGDTLQSTLQAWCKRANVELSWQAEYDYPLQASVSLSGTFEEAVRGLLVGFQDASPQPVGFLHNNQLAGQTVLVVQVRGNSYNE